jgi:general secretion pathway protein K
MKRKQRKKMQRQKGAVLIIAVFITSIIVAIAARFTGEFQLSVARTEHHIIHTQLQQFLYSVEDFAGWVLIEDAQTDTNNGRYAKNGIYGNYDHLQESWTKTLQAPIEEAVVEASLEDALSRFNLNQLQGRPAPYNAQGLFNERFTTAQQRFMRLLQTHPDGTVDSTLAESITQAVIDWVDVDSTITGQGGAEDAYYASLDPPYRPANRFFISVTELKQVKGMTNEIYDYLAPLLIALPNNQGFNINTASVALMRSLNQQNIEAPLSEEAATILMAGRPQNANETAYESANDFLESSEANQIFDTNPTFWPVANGLRTGSEFFILTAKVSLVGYEQQLTSIIKRVSTQTGVKTIVLRRTREQL